MSEFVLNTEYYGGYAYVKTGFSRDTHIYKIVNAIQSNSYCDVPVKIDSAPYRHENIELVLNVIHCGIDETNVVRVAVKDCDKVNPPTAANHGKWANAYKSGTHFYRCTECGEYIEAIWIGGYDFKYCPNCGAKMEGER